MSATTEPEFDAFATDYHDALKQGLKFTGEGAEYFAEGRTRWTASQLGSKSGEVRRILDFGCGTGTGTRFLLNTFPGSELVGTDPSEASLEVARRDHEGLPCTFVTPDKLSDCRSFDLAFCNGVFHHILPAERAAAVASVYQALAKGGSFALWENNPWNPAVHFIMSRVAFDRDAILLWPAETRRLLSTGGLSHLSTTYRFIFPSLLKMFRPLEKFVCRLPLGGQYLVLARKSS